MAISALVGCTTPNDNVIDEEATASAADVTTEAQTEQETEEFKPDIEQKDYKEEFYLNILPDVNPTDFYWVKEASDSVLSNALYNRPTMIGETLEMLSYYSEEVNIAFYEKMLGKQVAEAPQDRKMLDIVWDSVCSELALTYYSIIKDDNAYVYCLGKLTAEGTTTTSRPTL